MRAIDLRYTRATASSIAALQSALPQCRIASIRSLSAPGVAEIPAPSARTPDAIADWIRRLGGSVDTDHGRIVSVNLSGSRLRDRDLANLSPLQGLLRLNLSTTEVGDLGAQALSTMTDLRELDLSHTLISDDGLRRLAPLVRLENLNLGYSLVEGAGLQHLRNLRT